MTGDDNTLQGDFGESWVHTVAAGSQLLHGPGDTRDLEKLDVNLILPEELPGTYHPRVGVQVKTTISGSWQENGDLSYALDVRTYDVLRRTDHPLRRILVVIVVSGVGDKVSLVQDGTLLHGKGLWVSLEGQPPTGNTESVTVLLPSGNTLNEAGLRTMLVTYGTHRSTPVEEYQEWPEEVAP